ncbi:oligosaccharide flippase family protein [Dissulfurispira sp.]|uniref:oligosaccharide flippase family protein n=1 Tax=Dissulfurispira sp. TaxID=2817609 RepID=UPI002FDA3BA2
MLGMYIPPVLLTTFWGNTAAGLFQSAYKVALVPILICTVLIQSIYPSIVSRFATSDKDSITNLYHFGTKMLLNIVLPCFVIFLFLSEEIIAFIYGKNYLEATWGLKAMAPYILLTAILGMSMHLLLAIDKQRIVAKIAVYTTIVSIIINFF